MSFAVVHMQKSNGGSVKGMQIHNQRERPSQTNTDINISKTPDNYDLVNSSPINYNKKIKIVIEGLDLKKAVRKDAVLMCNFLVTSDKEFFDRLPENRHKEFFEKSVEFFADRYGKENIIAAPVHVDEKTPHMHLSLVPVTKDRKLSAKRLFDRNELRSIQDDYPKHMLKNGFNLKRGLDSKGKNKHVEINQFKKETLEKDVIELGKTKDRIENRFFSLQDQISDLAHENTKIKEERTKLSESLTELKEQVVGIKPDWIAIEGIKGEKKGLRKKKIQLDVSEFEQLKKLALKSVDLQRENNGLTTENKRLWKDKKISKESFSYQLQLTRALTKAFPQLKPIIDNRNREEALKRLEDIAKTNNSKNLDKKINKSKGFTR